LIVGIVVATVLITNAQSEENIFDSIYSWQNLNKNEVGFSFDYPTGPKWTKFESKVLGEVKIMNTAGELGHKNKFYPDNVKISTYIRDNSEGYNITEWFNSLPKDNDSNKNINSLENLVVKDRPSMGLNITDSFGNNAKVLFVPLKNNKILEIGIIPYNNFTKDLLNKIINSLKLAE